MTDREHNLWHLIEELRKADATYPLLDGLVYRSMYGFLAEHGREYERIPWRWPYPQGVPTQCYGNAVVLAAKHGLKYVEGVALSPKLEVIIHGWNVDAEDRLIDSTWMNTGLLYFGVEFSVERADDATWNGDAHVLNDDNRNYPLFQQRWQGEDYARVWPYSDRLAAYRREDGFVPESVLRWLKEQGL